MKPASLPRTVDALLSLELASEAREPTFSFCAIAAGALLVSGLAPLCTPPAALHKTAHSSDAGTQCMPPRQDGSGI